MQPFPSSQSRSLPHPAGNVVVVVAGPQLPALQASQQLASLPTQALPPGGAVHSPAPPLTLHLVAPSALVRQQVTRPGRPHVERAAQRTAAGRHCGGRRPARASALATRATQST